MISVHFQTKLFSITVIQFYASTTNAKEAEQFYDELQDLLELTPIKDVLFIIGDRNAKVGIQEIPGVTDKFGFGEQDETGHRLTISSTNHNGDSKHPLPRTQDTSRHIDITRWPILKSE